MLRLLLFGSAIVAVVDHRNPAAGWQTVQSRLVFVVPCGRRAVADGWLFNLLIAVCIVDAGRARCTGLAVFQLIGGIIGIRCSSCVDILERSVASRVVSEGLAVSVCSGAVFSRKLVPLVVAPRNSGRAATLDHDIAVSGIIVAVVELLHRGSGGTALNDLRRLARRIVYCGDSRTVGVFLNSAASRVVITESRAFVVPISERRQPAGGIKDKRSPTSSGVVDRAFQPDCIVRECLSLIVRACCDYCLSHRIEGGSIPSCTVGHQGAISHRVGRKCDTAPVRVFAARQLTEHTVAKRGAIAAGIDPQCLLPGLIVRTGGSPVERVDELRLGSRRIVREAVPVAASIDQRRRLSDGVDLQTYGSLLFPIFCSPQTVLAIFGSCHL